LNYILKNENAVYYECGYSCDNVVFIKLSNESFFITDARYTQEAVDATADDCEVVQSTDLLKSAREILRKSKIKSLVYDPNEWSVSAFEALQKLKIKFLAKQNFSHLKRAIKTKKEISYLQKAVDLGALAFDNFASEVEAGMSEMQLNFLAKKALSYEGANELSFTPIVAINANASKPHAVATEQILANDDLLLMDAGLKYKRYCSDRTRTAFFNKELEFPLIQKFANKKIQKAYDTVLKAHDVSIEKARAGMKACEIDALAREVIEKAGFGQYFVHSTGHGVGLDIHEMPFISSKSQMRIEENMVFTIEPGIYIPGEFGIRIEDMVVMQANKAAVL
jgi:Xaa-Pro aminopeptidase